MKMSMRLIATLLLTMFLWSCFGLGIGMFFHPSHQHDSIVEKTDGMHDCCGDASFGSTQADIIFFNHHQMDPVVNELIKISVIFIVSLVAFFTLFHQKVFFGIDRYILYWERSILYFALYIQRLLRRGILHPKIW